MNAIAEYLHQNRVSRARLEGETRDEHNRLLPHRSAFPLLKKHARDFFTRGHSQRMFALSGLRGVGKTTLMWQTAKYVYSNHTQEIYAINAEEVVERGGTLYDVVQALEEKIYQRPLNELPRRIMLMIDEVHEAEGWQRALKILYEKGKKIFVLTTGSSSLLLQSSPDLASRWDIIKIYPFSFPEFVLSKSWLQNLKPLIYPTRNLAQKVREALLHSADYTSLKARVSAIQPAVTQYLTKASRLADSSRPLSKVVDEYVSYHNIARFLSITNRTRIVERIWALFDRILYKDISPDPLHIYIYRRLLTRIAQSDELNFQTLSRDFQISESEVESLIERLHRAEILNIFFPHGGVRARTGLRRKALFMSPSLRRALYTRLYGFGHRLDSALRAKLYEDIVAMYLRRHLPDGVVTFGAGGRKNPDFVIEMGTFPILIEVGSSAKTSTSQITASGIDYRYGLVLNATRNQSMFFDDRRVAVLPLTWFLLM